MPDRFIPRLELEFKYNTLYRFNIIEMTNKGLDGIFKYNTLYRFNG